jgi:hypothetical protein
MRFAFSLLSEAAADSAIGFAILVFCGKVDFTM